MSDIQKKPDELWTTYLIRKLAAEGIDVGDFETDEENDPGASHADLPLEGDRNFSITKTFDRMAMPELDSPQDSLLEEAVLIDVVSTEEDTGEYDLVFMFEPSGNVEVQNMTHVQIKGFLAKYRLGGTYTPEEVIADLVQYAKDPSSSSGEYCDHPSLLLKAPIQAIPGVSIRKGIEEVIRMSEGAEKPVTVGIYGVTNSGKTYFSIQLFEELKKAGKKVNMGKEGDKPKTYFDPNADFTLLEGYVWVGPMQAQENYGRPVDIKVLVKHEILMTAHEIEHARPSEYDIVVDNPGSMLKPSRG